MRAAAQFTARPQQSNNWTCSSPARITLHQHGPAWLFKLVPSSGPGELVRALLSSNAPAEALHVSSAIME
ncbi:hypothetical protein E3U43_022590 [Larimichthys crocea]|uniref:Uncharacterized protein n=1 Tax=Larimichthys crocea TaxID=215358 RepID=A0ACD3R3Z1_LARCR|nr:hypothetical protein E3U43_022590 [Larimichthys crocea]